MAFHLASKFRANLPFSAFVAVGGVYALAIAAIAAVIEHKTVAALAGNQTPWMLAALLLSTAVICYLLQRVLHRVEELHLRNKLDVKYFPAESKGATAKMYRAASDLFELAKHEATCEIFAVNCFDDAFAHLSQDDEAAHAGYFAALEGALDNAKYHRILQYDDEVVKGDLTPYLTPAYRSHFLRLIERGEAGPKHTIKIEKVAPRYPTAYVIIDNKSGPSHLIWQLNEYVHTDPGTRPKFRPRGVLLITDPEQQLIRHFKSWFTQLTSSGARSVRRSELGAASKD